MAWLADRRRDPTPIDSGPCAAVGIAQRLSLKKNGTRREPIFAAGFYLR